MSNNTNVWWRRALTLLPGAPLFVIGWMIKVLYTALEAPFERRLAKSSAVAFSQEIADALTFAIEKYGAEVLPVVPRAEIRAFDYVEAAVRIKHVRLYISRCRGDFTASVAPDAAPSIRHDLLQVLDVCNQRPVVGGFFRDQWDLATQLEPHLECVLHWLEPDFYHELQSRLDSPEMRGQRRQLKAMENEINRKLYG